MQGEGSRGIEKSHQAVTEKFIDDSILLVDGLTKHLKVASECIHRLLRGNFFGIAGKTLDIAKKHRDEAFLTAKRGNAARLDQVAHDVDGHILGKRLQTVAHSGDGFRKHPDFADE